MCENGLGLKFLPDGRGDLAATFGPEDVFAYAYAVFHSQTYRDRYAAFLKTNFPRLPVTSNPDLFRILVAKGDELISLHTFDSPLVSVSMTHYPVKGSDKVEQMPVYLAPGEADPMTGDELTDGRVYISKDKKRTKERGQYIEGVPVEVWEFTIGGYQVCQKWLKDRRDRVLTDADLTHYGKIVAAISETIRVMEEIDGEIEEWPIA
jgi:predicted helicase